MSSSSEIEVRTDRIVGPLPHVWNGVLGSMNSALLRTGRRLLGTLSGVSRFPYYRRTMGTLSTGSGRPVGDRSATNVYHEDASGSPFYDFELFDQILDPHVAMGLIPYLGMDFMPSALSAAPEEIDGRPPLRDDAFPPKDYRKWHDLVAEVVRHCVDRYGAEEVSRWCFEMWNEPDLSYYWMGSTEEFCRLYDHTVAAIKGVLPAVRVGGNAVAGFRNEVFRDFLVHCTSGTNDVTGSKGAPLDFISFHVKGGPTGRVGNMTSEALRKGYPIRGPSLTAMIEKIDQGMNIIQSVPGTAGLPVHLTECDIDWGVGTGVYENPNMHYRNSEYFAAFQCALCKEMLDLRDRYPDNPIDLTFIDTFCFEGRRIFAGARTLITADNVAKPILNALRALGMLGDQRLEVSGAAGPVDALASCSEDGAVQVMVYNFAEAFTPEAMAGGRAGSATAVEVAVSPEAGAATVTVDAEAGSPPAESQSKSVKLRLSGLGDEAVRVEHFRIDRNHSNAYTLWKGMGSPLVPDEAQLAELHRRMGLEALGDPQTYHPDTGCLELPLELPPHSVSLIVVTAAAGG